MSLPVLVPEQHARAGGAVRFWWLLLQRTSPLRNVDRSQVITVAILCCATLVSAIHLRSTSIWYDEALTLLMVSGTAQTNFDAGVDPFKPSVDLREILTDLHNQDVHPPLYFWTLALWRVAFGESLEVARTLSALFVAGTLLVLYSHARMLGMRWPWVPMAAFALSGVGLQYAFDARPYAMAVFFIVLTLVLEHRKSYWTGICAAAAIATHYFAALCVVPILAIAFISEWPRKRNWVWATTISFAICVAPLLPLLRVHFTARPHQFHGFGPVWQEFYALLKGATSSGLPHSWLPGWGFALLTAGMIACAGIWHCHKQKQFAIPFAYVAFLTGFVVLAASTNKSIVEMPDEYYLGIAAPLLALLLGFGLHSFPRVSPLLALLAITGIATASPLIKAANYRAIAERVRAQCRDCTIVVGNGYAGAVPACLLYETKGMRVVVLHAGETAEDVLARTGEQQTLLFVKTNEPPTRQSENQFLESYPAIWKAGYFEVYPYGVPKRAADSGDAGVIASTNRSAREVPNRWH